jgi:GAF domain-containing protein
LLGRAQELLLRARDADAPRMREVAERIEHLETSLAEMDQLLARTERQAAQLANLYVATYQLHASLDPEDVCAAIADIAVNLLGAERFWLLVAAESGELSVTPQSALTPSRYLDEAGRYRPGDPLVDECARSLCIGFGPVPESHAVAVVPFAAQGQLIGLLIIDAFLRHKHGLTSEDRELLDLLAAHAASALLAARVFHVTQRKLHTYEGLLGLLRRGG